MAKELNKDIILNFLHSNKNYIRNLGVDKLVLFGSYAREEERKDSDIDFLVEFSEYNIDNHLALLHFLEDSFGKKVDLIKPQFVREELRKEILGGTQYVAKI